MNQSNQKENMTNTLPDGYNIVPASNIVELPAAIPPKPRTMTLFFCGIQWAVISGIVMYFVNKNGSVFPFAAGALMLALAVAALGLVWGVFQHVLKTIVRIVRNGS